MHVHSHMGEASCPANERLALMKYMLQHNEQHLSEFEKLAAELSEAGSKGAAKHLKKSIAHLKKANTELSGAIAHLEEE